jgi:hypothetical protein
LGLQFAHLDEAYAEALGCRNVFARSSARMVQI